MRFRFIQQHGQHLSVSFLCQALAVSRSGYYQWRLKRGATSPRRQAQQQRDRAISKAFDDSKSRDGARRIQAELIDRGMCHDIKTISDSMRRQRLTPKAAKKFKVTTDSNHKLPVAPNLLDRDFNADAPNQKWAGDITYLYTSEGWLYLAVMIDLYSRAVIGWSMSSRMTADLACDALQMALYRRSFPEDVIVHSDRGSQYCSGAYRGLIEQHKLQQSMSRAVFEYIEVDYNRKRRHSALGYLSPEKYEMKLVA
ncbi:Uncharacterised protein [BD1-7 clade bacterium]|uniref:Integrase catalytic domain-containing protein n=1 Tax=BD1-7 clade bacterium TaxID=2029982 RepID=A0A5S9QVN8_9GAMM|nr:Uncharacterised protein [BD1-7 clade bacterium]